MKILLIDNNTEHKQALIHSLAGHDIEVQKYSPGMKFNYRGKDLVILSGGGGEGHEIDDKHDANHLWYEDEIKFVKTCKKPVVGICMGFEVIASAFGAKVDEMKKEIKGFKQLRTTREGQRLLASKSLKQYEAHKWRVKNPPRGFEVLARSGSGVELISHKTRPIIATQFHPEKGGTVDLAGLIANLAPAG